MISFKPQTCQPEGSANSNSSKQFGGRVAPVWRNPNNMKNRKMGERTLHAGSRLPLGAVFHCSGVEVKKELDASILRSDEVGLQRRGFDTSAMSLTLGT
jgi:hypothetical protein